MAHLDGPLTLQLLECRLLHIVRLSIVIHCLLIVILHVSIPIALTSNHCIELGSTRKGKYAGAQGRTA
jgi:hypothetical protein